MARQFMMTWNRKQGRWFKKLGGKPYAVSCRQLKSAYPALYQADTEEGSYRAANAWWQQKAVSLDSAASVGKVLRDVAHLADIEKIEVANRANILAAFTFLEGRERTPSAMLDFTRIISGVQVSTTAPTLAAVKAEFLATQFVEVGPHGITAGRYEVLRRQLTTFCDFCGNDTPITAINAGTLTGYHTHLLDKIKGGISTAYAHSNYAIVKQFLNWCYVSEKIDALPRNFRTLTIKITHGQVKTYSIDSLKALLAVEMTERTRLFALLMLNCGFTQQDISDLTPSEINWNTGVITRKRSKTKKHDNCPIVSYPLWKETFALLKNHGGQTGDKVFTTGKGQALVYASLTAGKIRHTDTITSAWQQVESPHKLALKYFRKTSATLLGGNRDFATIADLFLGHSPKTIAEKHYKKAPLDLLADGVRWLGSVYGLDG